MAVLPIGYADGLHRVLSGRGSVWLDGKRRPIIGRVCMDMCMVALEDGDQVKAGDEIVGSAGMGMGMGSADSAMTGGDGMSMSVADAGGSVVVG